MFSIVSVIKNVTDREAMFRRSIESVLGQTWTDFELVIQDGGSTDRTADIVAEYRDPRIQFLSVPDSSGEEGFFHALKRCRGAYIGSCLSDEELLPEALENARRAFEDHPDIAAFYGNVCYVNEKGEKWGPRVPPHPFLIEAYVCQILVPPFCSSFFRREAVEKAGLHAHHWRYNIGEFEFWIRIADVGGIIYLPYNISHFGRHSQSNTLNAGLYDRLVAERERVMPDLFRENKILRECHVSVEQAIAGNYVWGASGVFNIEGPSQKCEYFMQQAERYAPKSPQLASLRSRIREAAPTQSASNTGSPAGRKDSSMPPSEEFARWLNALSSMDNRLYYRDQSPDTLAALCSLTHGFDPTVIVELGTLGGLSLRTWLAGSARARVVAIDLSFAKLAETRRVLPLDLPRVTLLEQDILKTDFASLWTARDRVVLFVDAHDLPNVPIMEYVLTKALPVLPDGSLVIVDDLWFSEQRLTQDNAKAFLEDHVVGEIDELQCFNGHYAPCHEGGSFMGFAEVIPLLEFVNRHRINLVHAKGGKHAYFVWKKECLTPRQEPVGTHPAELPGCVGSVLYNPLESVPVSASLRETMRHVVAAYQGGQVREVAEYLQQLLAQHRHDQGLYYALAVCLARLGMLSQARDVLGRGSTDSNHPRYQRLLDDLARSVEPSESHQSQNSPQPTDECGMTIFAMPKPFAGHIATIQKNAIRSWARLRPTPEIILFGDEPGIRQMAEEIGAHHIPEISRNEFGTPLVNKLFQAAQDHASHAVVAYVNADMILFQDFVEAVQKVQAGLSDFLLIGQRWDIPLFDEIDFDRPQWQATLQRQMQEQAMIHPETGLDYFAFRKGLWPAIPSFALGRTAWDNWLVMDPHKRGVPVVDGTEGITAVHQDHDYGHVAGGRQEAWAGAEAARNRALAGAMDGCGCSSGATYALNKEGALVKVQMRESWCTTAVYKNERSAWLAEQANSLIAIDKNELAACKCEEALGILRQLLLLKQRGYPQVESLDPTIIAQRYARCHVLLAQCHQKMGHYDQVAAIYTQLLENPFVQIPQTIRDDIVRLRDQSARLVRDRQPVAHGGAHTGREVTSGPRPNSPSASEPPAALLPERERTVNVPDHATCHGHVLAELEAKYGSMPDSAPAKRVTAVRLSELCRRIGQTERGNAYAIQALKIKNGAALEEAKGHKPSLCGHKPMIVEFNVVASCHDGPHGDTLELGRFKRLADELLPSARIAVLIGGEVLLHPDFCDMCEYANRFGVSLEMATNLCSLADRQAEAIRRFVHVVRVSVDGATKRTCESIRTHLSFDTLQENLRTLAEIKRQRADLKLELVFAALRQNIAELPDTIEMAGRLGFDSVSVSFVQLDGELTMDDSLLFHRELANRYFDLARRQAEALGLRLDIPGNFDVTRQPFLAPEVPAVGHEQCLRPWDRVRVLTNGDIIPCCYLHSLPVGNALADSFEPVWNGPQYAELSGAVGNSSERLPGRCQHCQILLKRTDSNDARLHISLGLLPAMKPRLEEAAPEPLIDIVAHEPGCVCRPNVTVVMACRDCERFLVDSLESVCNQSMQEWELFLLDDASADGTRRIMEEYARRDPRIKPYYFDTSAGPYVRRNFAIERANTDFIVIHDSDDLMVATKLETLYREISNDSHLAMVGSFYRIFFEDFKGLQYTDLVELPIEHEDIAENALTWRHGVSHISAIIRKSIFDCIGGYDENPFASDAFWSAKLAEYSRHGSHVRFKNIPESLTLYRVHSVSQTQVLSTFDPRNRRVRYCSYCECKLDGVRKKMQSAAQTDIGQELRHCTCSDFLTRFRAHIIQWENEPLDQRAVANLLRSAVEAFNNGHHVSCVNILNGVETMEPSIVRRIVGFDLLMGMAFLALDMRERSRVCLERETHNHDSPAARKFMADAIEAEAPIDVLAWCQAHAESYNLGLSDAAASVSQGGVSCAGAVRK